MAYDKLRFRARLILSVGAHLGVPETIEVPVQSVRATHDENSIPMCTVSAATGRATDNLLSKAGISPVHTISSQLNLPTRAIVEIKVTREDSSEPMLQVWPEDWFTAFDGWVANVSPSVSRGDRSVVIQLTHWLSNLDFSSPYSEDAFPTTPADFLFNAATTFGTGANRKIVGSTAVSKALTSFTSTSLLTDFWDDANGAGLRPFLAGIAGERLFNWRQLSRFTGVTQENPNFTPTNSLMNEALNRFEPFYDPDSGELLYDFGTYLALRPDLEGFNQIANRIRAQVCEAAYSPYYIGTTMWDRLISGMTNQYMFSVIPMVDRALTVPYAPWLNTPWATLSSEDMDVLQYSLQVRRPIRAVAVVGTYGSWTGLNANRQPGGTTASSRQAMGYFEPPFSAINGTKNGMIMTVEAPVWINDLLLQGVSSHTAPKTGKIAVAQNPQAFSDFVGPPYPNKVANLELELADKKLSGAALSDALAKATYLQEVTKWRQMVVSTNFRFDIAPGSTIAINSSPDSMLGAVLSENGMPAGDSYIARVVRVSWNLEVTERSGTASTVYHLAYIRSLIENEDAAFSADDHPLWRDTWTGAPLVGQDEFRH